MKNKKKTYLLLVAVLSIWGIIGYKIWTGLNPGIPEVAQQDVDVSFNPKANAVIDTFSVQTTDRDPFLGTLRSQQIVKSSPTLNKNHKKLIWLPISYHGIVKKQASTQQVFVVSINKQQHLLKKGQRMDSITLIRGNAKAIVMRYKNQQKTFNIVQ